MRDLSLAAAPELVALIPCNAGYYAVLITRYSACPGERIRRATTTKEPFRAAARARFRADMTALASHGLMHPYVRGLFHWLVSSETRTLLLDGWSSVREAEPGEADEMLEIVDRMLTASAGE